MSEYHSFSEEVARTSIIVAALALGRSLDLWSIVLAAFALAGLLQMSLPLLSIICLLLSLLAGGTQKIFALRVAFDEDILRGWAKTWSGYTDDSFTSTVLLKELAMFDQSLTACGLREYADGAVRSLDSRLHGAKKLFFQQLLAVAIQFVSMIIAMLAMHMPAVS